MTRKVVITGLGVISPIGNDLKTTWQGIINGASGIKRISGFDASTFPVQIAGEITDFSFDTSLLPEELQNLTGRSIQLGIEASGMALKDSGLELKKEDPVKIGVSLGGDEEYIKIGNIENIYAKDLVHNAFVEGQNAYCHLLKHSPSVAKTWSARRRTDTGTKILSLLYNLQGPLETSHTSCSSSGHALGKAKRLIEDGDCDIVLSGGHCSMLSEFSVGGFHLLGTLSTRNDEPHRASRPFDLDRDGFIMGEGAGIVILEELEHAKKRGAHIYAEFAGYGSSSNAYRLTDTPPDGRGGDLSMLRAVNDAGANKKEVSYINAHGTATLVNDRSETLSIKKVFGDQAYNIPISSSKSMLGHLVCSSSAVEFAITTLAVKENIVPPTTNLETPDPKCDLDYIPGQARETEVNLALSNSFAFGGQNATLAIKKFKG